MARYGPKGKRYDTISQKILQYNTVCINATLNLTRSNTGVSSSKNVCCCGSGCEPGRYSRMTYRSETANMGTCSDDLKRGRLIGNVDRRQRDVGTGDNGDAAMVDRQVRGRARSTTLYKWRRVSDREQRCQHRATSPLDRADQ